VQPLRQFFGLIEGLADRLLTIDADEISDLGRFLGEVERQHVPAEAQERRT
jgi:hypothetical protein